MSDAHKQSNTPQHNVRAVVATTGTAMRGHNAHELSRGAKRRPHNARAAATTGAAAHASVRDARKLKSSAQHSRRRVARGAGRVVARRTWVARRGLLVLLFAGCFAALACGGAADGPAPVPYDRVQCAQCSMLVSEPRFAAQALAPGGTRRYFDDPGCLLLHLETNPELAQQSWLRHVHEERWLPLAAAGFVTASPTPMAYGFGAVPRETAGALAPEAALRSIRERHEAAPRQPAP